MSIKKNIVCYLMALLTLCALSTKGQQESIIVGSGFLKDDLIYPYSIQITNSKILMSLTNSAMNLCFVSVAI